MNPIQTEVTLIPSPELLNTACSLDLSKKPGAYVSLLNTAKEL